MNNLVNPSRNEREQPNLRSIREVENCRCTGPIIMLGTIKIPSIKRFVNPKI